jgi:hypothetical protein
MDDLINEYYEKTNYGNPDKIYKAMIKDGIKIKKTYIKTYLDALIEQQLTKETRINRNNFGHIVAFQPNEFWQIDLYDLSKYSTSNKNYKYIFAVVDVFSRKSYCIAMKTKNIDDTTLALEKVIKLAGVAPNVITCDSDSSFLGGKFDASLNRNKITLQPVVVGDHHALGIIDRFARTLKQIITKIMLKNKSKLWIDYLDKIVSNYNSLSHSSLNDLSPNEALLKENYETIYDINIDKNIHNNNVSDLEPDDNVRIRIGGKFKKGTEPLWSDEIYTVKSVNSKSITLTDGTRKKRTDLLKIPNGTQEEPVNIIVKNNKAQTIKRTLNKDGIDKRLILKTSRR